MDESKGHLCPECGAPRGADNTPSCGCGQRASDALRDARTAEAAAAEDFDPLRIRPYVELEGAREGGTAAAEETAPLPRVPGAPGLPGVPGVGVPDVPGVPAAEATMPLRAVAPDAQAPDATSALPTPLAPSASEPSTTDLSLFDGAGAPGGGGYGDGYGDSGDFGDFRGEESRRPRRTLLLGAAGGLVAVVVAAGLASGLFSYDTPSRDGALPEEVRASVPDASTSSASASTSAESVKPTSASPSPTASESPSASPSPSPSRSSASPTSSGSAEPSATATVSESAEDSGNSRQSSPTVLSRGSQGPEVVELELRLTQVGLYSRKASGHYNEGVEDAVSNYQLTRGIQAEVYGVYDLVTRERLESETTEP